MDDKAIRSQLEQMLRDEDRALVVARKKQLDEMAALSDEEWWQHLILQTKEIRPQMIEVFERNKEAMIAGRDKPAKQEIEFREKAIQRRIQELLPFLMELRLETGATGNLTRQQFQIANERLDGAAAVPPSPPRDRQSLN